MRVQELEAKLQQITGQLQEKVTRRAQHCSFKFSNKLALTVVIGRGGYGEPGGSGPIFGGIRCTFWEKFAKQEQYVLLPFHNAHWKGT